MTERLNVKQASAAMADELANIEWHHAAEVRHCFLAGPLRVSELTNAALLNKEMQNE